MLRAGLNFAHRSLSKLLGRHYRTCIIAQSHHHHIRAGHPRQISYLASFPKAIYIGRGCGAGDVGKYNLYDFAVDTAFRFSHRDNRGTVDMPRDVHR